MGRLEEMRSAPFCCKGPRDWRHVTVVNIFDNSRATAKAHQDDTPFPADAVMPAKGAVKFVDFQLLDLDERDGSLSLLPADVDGGVALDPREGLRLPADQSLREQLVAAFGHGTNAGDIIVTVAEVF